MTVDYNRESEMIFDFDEDEILDTLVGTVVKEFEIPYEVSVSVSVVGEDEIRRINREFRDIDRVTDVLSFPMNEFDEPGVFAGETFEMSSAFDPETDELLLGDIVLCAERVRSQAVEYGHTERLEYAFLVVHSLLHLCGFDHITDAGREEMEEKQTQILNHLGIFR